MAIKTLADIQTQLSTGGSSGHVVQQDLIQDIVDSFVIATTLADYPTEAELTTTLADYKTEASLLQAAQANSVAADVATLVADFNSLLAKLRLAGILAP